MTKIYGIKNCDTIKKALKWLDTNNIPYEFHDFKTAGLPQALLNEWLEKSSWDLLINKRSTTYRGLPQETKDNLNEALACQAMLDHPTLVKRPVLVTNPKIHIGFKAEQYQEIFS